MRFPIQSTLLAASALITLGVAGTSIGAATGSNHVVRYVCPDGERFSVEYKRSHARLRNGSGVFSLTADGGASSRYSDGSLTLSPHDGGVLLQRAGQNTRSEEHTSELQSPKDLVC